MEGSGKDSLKPPGAKRLAAGLGGGRPRLHRPRPRLPAGRSTMIENIMDKNQVGGTMLGEKVASRGLPPGVFPAQPKKAASNEAAFLP